MFNPQRKAKISDIYMQEKAYSLHLQKMKQIDRTLPISRRYEEDHSQEKYLSTLSNSKREVHNRLTNSIRRENNRLLNKLITTEIRKDPNPQSNSPKHFNSYFTTKKESQRIKNQNYTMIVRMLTNSPQIPTLQHMQQGYKNTRRLLKQIRKLPAIMKHQRDCRQMFSTHNIHSNSREASGNRHTNQ